MESECKALGIVSNLRLGLPWQSLGNGHKYQRIKVKHEVMGSLDFCHSLCAWHATSQNYLALAASSVGKDKLGVDHSSLIHLTGNIVLTSKIFAA